MNRTETTTWMRLIVSMCCVFGVVTQDASRKDTQPQTNPKADKLTYKKRRTGNCNNNACNKAGTACLQGCKPGFTGYVCSEDEESATSAETIAGIVVGGIVGLVIIVLLSALTVIMYRRFNLLRGQEKSVTVVPRNIYDDLTMTDPTSANGDYDHLDQESRISRNEIITDETGGHDYVNTAI